MKCYTIIHCKIELYVIYVTDGSVILLSLKAMSQMALMDKVINPHVRIYNTKRIGNLSILNDSSWQLG